MQTHAQSERGSHLKKRENRKTVATSCQTKKEGKERQDLHLARGEMSYLGYNSQELQLSFMGRKNVCCVAEMACHHRLFLPSSSLKKF